MDKIAKMYMAKALSWYAPYGAKKAAYLVAGLAVIPFLLLNKKPRNHQKYFSSKEEFDEWRRYIKPVAVMNKKVFEFPTTIHYIKEDISENSLYFNRKDGLGDVYWVRDHHKSWNSFKDNYVWLALRNPVAGLKFGVAGDTYIILQAVGNRIEAFKKDPSNSVDGWSYIEAVNDTTGKLLKGFYYRDTDGRGTGNRGLEIKVGAKLEQLLFHGNSLYDGVCEEFPEDITGTLQIGKKFIYN
jgi:hypothetical protein